MYAFTSEGNIRFFQMTVLFHVCIVINHKLKLLIKKISNWASADLRICTIAQKCPQGFAVTSFQKTLTAVSATFSV